MSRSFLKRSGEEVEKINRVQRDFFSGLIHVFDPPLPEGVPQRLEHIVASGEIGHGDVLLDVGSGTGVLIPFLEAYQPKRIYACDLSQTMVDHLLEKYPFVQGRVGDVTDLDLASKSLDVAFINAAYPNIVDKDRAFLNLSRMLKVGGRLIISHPMGRSFVERLKDRSPFPLDEFPLREEADELVAHYGLEVVNLVDDPKLYLLVVRKI